MSEKLTCEDEQEYPLKDHSLVFWDDGGMSIHSSLSLTIEELSEDEDGYGVKDKVLGKETWSLQWNSLLHKWYV